MADSPPLRNRAFVSYSHADAEHLTRLHVHLAPYEREQKVDVWDDTRIKPGMQWKEEIKQAMAEAKVAILLVSADFMASEFIAHDELPPLLEAAEQEGTLIVPVILSPCAFQWSKLARYQSLNAPSDPLIDMPRGKQEAIWARLAKYVADALAPAPSDILKPMPGAQKKPSIIKNRLRRFAGMFQQFLKPVPLAINSLLVRIRGRGMSPAYPINKGASSASTQRKISRRALLVGGGVVVVGGLGIAGDLVWQAIQYRFLSIGTLIYTYRRHPITVRAVAWSPDSSRIASGSRDKTVQVWNASNGDFLFEVVHESDVETVAWSPDGARIASGSNDQTALVWDASNGNQISVFQHDATVEAVAWSPDSKSIASGSDDRTVQVGDASNGAVIFTYYGHLSVVRAVAWSRNNTIASGGDDTTVQIWDAANGTPLYTYRGHYQAVRSVAWSPDGTRIASGGGLEFGDYTIQVWDTTNGILIFTYGGHTDIVEAVAWSPDGTRIASGSHDNTVQVWDAKSGTHLYTYTGHTHWVYSVAWSPDGTRIASAGADNTVQVWAAG